MADAKGKGDTIPIWKILNKKPKRPYIDSLD